MIQIIGNQIQQRVSTVYFSFTLNEVADNVGEIGTHAAAAVGHSPSENRGHSLAWFLLLRPVLY